MTFKSQLDSLFNSLRTTHQKSDFQPEKIRHLAEEHILNRWDVEGTLLLMIGKSLWEDMTNNQQLSLKEEFKLTLLRYFMEAYAYYDGQNVHFEKLILNKDQNKGWVGISIELQYAPDMPVEFNIIQSKSGDWLFRDIRFQGIQYSKMKRNYYQNKISEIGVSGLINELAQKNEAFFAETGLSKSIQNKKFNSGTSGSGD
ncbi:MAG: ABC transporter substrate-binding protein [Gammaproteobacteria bacterium]|nr:ABC transporter substrate-binding protein [Gammaproteobacteria bacterium]